MNAVQLKPKGLAFCDFVFRDGLRLGLPEMELYKLGKQLIEKWDGSETLMQMYQREREWPDTISGQ